MGMDPSTVWLWEGDIPLGAGPSRRESCGSDTEVDRLSAKCAEDLCGVGESVGVRGQEEAGGKRSQEEENEAA